MDYSRFDVIGIGFPIYAGSMSRLVRKFIIKLPFARGRKAFIYQVAASPSKINYPGMINARRLLLLKTIRLNTRGCL